MILLFIPTKYRSNPLKIKVTYHFEKKVKQKVNLRWHPQARPDIAILKDQFLKNLSKNVMWLPTLLWSNVFLHRNGLITTALPSASNEDP